MDTWLDQEGLGGSGSLRGDILEGLGRHLGRSWAVFGMSWGVLERLGGVLKGSGGMLGTVWASKGRENE